MNLPKAFMERMQYQLNDEADNFFASLTSPSPTSVRSNSAKGLQMQGRPVPWCSDGIYLESRPSFTLDPPFHAGCYYVQEASSMFLEQVIKSLDLNNKGIIALDACAAPGGKTTHLASLLNEESLVISNETIASRVSVLKENVIKWGTGNILVTNNDTSAFATLNGLFDLILVDAPCSGEGLFRKDTEAITEWGEDNCSLCSGRQQRILNNLLPSLKENGYLIYCTCTYNPGENEKNVEWLCEKHGMECISISLNPEWNIKEVNVSNGTAYAFYPHRLAGEGFFISVLRKRNSQGSVSFKKGEAKYSPLPSSLSQVQHWVNISDNFKLFKKSDEIYQLPQKHMQAIEFLEKHLRVQYAGVLVGKIKHTDVIPAHELAMCVQLNKESFAQIQLSRTEALSYLRKEEIKVNSSKKGWNLATYEGKPLGWLNNLGNRFNNYYPVDWRIRMKG
jgi:16S rRNA C967 or C1407 C5-methylase (RsmB/RsmF family)/NOL1/NOP2/fmu family ribosome biogenesis protein